MWVHYALESAWVRLREIHIAYCYLIQVIPNQCSKGERGFGRPLTTYSCSYAVTQRAVERIFNPIDTYGRRWTKIVGIVGSWWGGEGKCDDLSCVV